LAYFQKVGQIFEAQGKIYQSIIKIADVPVTMNSAAEFQVANVLASVAACRIARSNLKKR